MQQFFSAMCRLAAIERGEAYRAAIEAVKGVIAARQNREEPAEESGAQNGHSASSCRRDPMFMALARGIKMRRLAEEAAAASHAQETTKKRPRRSRGLESRTFEEIYESLESFIKERGGDARKLKRDWRIEFQRCGDPYYVGPNERRARSKVEVARCMGLPEQPIPFSKRSAALFKKSSKRKKPEAEAAEPQKSSPDRLISTAELRLEPLPRTRSQRRSLPQPMYTSDDKVAQRKDADEPPVALQAENSVINNVELPQAATEEASGHASEASVAIPDEVEPVQLQAQAPVAAPAVSEDAPAKVSELPTAVVEALVEAPRVPPPVPSPMEMPLNSTDEDFTIMMNSQVFTVVSPPAQYPTAPNESFVVPLLPQSLMGHHADASFDMPPMDIAPSASPSLPPYLQQPDFALQPQHFHSFATPSGHHQEYSHQLQPVTGAMQQNSCNPQPPTGDAPTPQPLEPPQSQLKQRGPHTSTVQA